MKLKLKTLKLLLLVVIVEPFNIEIKLPCYITLYL